MSLTLIKEDGTGRSDANSYASVAEGDAYHDGHLYAASWTGASTAQKEAALVMATRLIDASYQFAGARKLATQALQWPRQRALDPDRRGVSPSVLDNTLGSYFDSDALPAAVVSAACEQARVLIQADRTADPSGEGIRQLTLVGSLAVAFDPKDRPPMLSHLVEQMLAKLGALLHPARGPVRLVRT